MLVQVPKYEGNLGLKLYLYPSIRGIRVIMYSVSLRWVTGGWK